VSLIISVWAETGTSYKRNGSIHIIKHRQKRVNISSFLAATCSKIRPPHVAAAAAVAYCCNDEYSMAQSRHMFCASMTFEACSRLHEHSDVHLHVATRHGTVTLRTFSAHTAHTREERTAVPAW